MQPQRRDRYLTLLADGAIAFSSVSMQGPGAAHRSQERPGRVTRGPGSDAGGGAARAFGTLRIQLRGVPRRG